LFASAPGRLCGGQRTSGTNLRRPRPETRGRAPLSWEPDSCGHADRPASELEGRHHEDRL